YGDGRDVFVSKVSQDGSVFLYSTYLGGTFPDEGFAITADPTGNVFITGTTLSTDFPTTAGAFDRSYNGGLDAFVTMLNTNGSALVYSTYLGGGFNDAGYGIAVDAFGRAHVAGTTSSTDFPTTIGGYGGGDSDGF